MSPMRSAIPVSLPTERIFVGLGANLGDARASVLQALRELATLPDTRVVAASALYLSSPVAAPGPDYINAVAELRTALSPEGLLRAMQAVEHAHGRERPCPNAPRTLDLDLLLFGIRQVAIPALVLPHPRLHLRAFVLQPLAELAPELVLPGLGPLAPWLARCADQRAERIDTSSTGRSDFSRDGTAG